MIIAPFLPGKGPSIRLDPDTDGAVTIEDNTPGAWPGAGPVPPKGTVVFRWERYNPGGFGWATDPRYDAESILAFCLAYVGRPEEFDCDPSEPEQEHAAFWRAYGDAFSGALEDSEEEDE
mgnify:CR=1 FL=1